LKKYTKSAPVKTIMPCGRFIDETSIAEMASPNWPIPDDKYWVLFIARLQYHSLYKRSVTKGTIKTVNKQLISSARRGSYKVAARFKQNCFQTFLFSNWYAIYSRKTFHKSRWMWGYVEQWFWMKSHRTFPRIDKFHTRKAGCLFQEDATQCVRISVNNIPQPITVHNFNFAIWWRKENSSFLVPAVSLPWIRQEPIWQSKGILLTEAGFRRW